MGLKSFIMALGSLFLLTLLSQIGWWAYMAHAQEKTVTVAWQAPPLERTDGTPITGGILYAYQLQWWGATSTLWLDRDTQQVPASQLTAIIPVYCGSYHIQVRAVVMDGAGNMLTSDWSNRAVYNTGVPCPPNMFQQPQAQ
jgi:hypothetical protein